MSDYLSMQTEMEMQRSWWMEESNTYTSTLSNMWSHVYDYIRIGDLVRVGPVHNKVFGIALQRKTVSFGYEPDEWIVLVDGELVTYQSYYINVYNDVDKITNNYSYNYIPQGGHHNGKKR